ncbi:MAG: FIST C-terminal domain-containing protein [Sulfuricellaceae bacterium]|nr:FIST C-terminal domain-containing protein [Sulfuricellaceae bacterium]
MTASAMRYLPCIEERLLEERLAEWQAVQPRMGVLALLPEAERDSVARVQQVCARRHIPVVGALFPALIEGGAFHTTGAWLLRFDEMPYAALHPNLPREPEKVPAAMDAIAAELGPHLNDSRDATLFLLFDAMVPNIATLLDELYLRLANRVHYMGANAGSETFRPMPCLFDGSRTVQDGVLAILMKPHPGAVLEHGYSAPPQMLIATSTEGNRIIHIDWRPAFEVYQEMARAQYGVEIDRENFYRHAVHFPFGIVRANGMILVRIPVALEEDGSLFCVGEVPPNALLTLLKAPAVDSVHTLDTLVQGLAALDGPLAGQELLLFYCAGRRLHLGIEAAENEVRELTRRTQAAQVAGALSLGEIGGSTQWGYPLFHNATLVASRWGGDSA